LIRLNDDSWATLYVSYDTISSCVITH